MYTVYILRSQSSGRFYIGCTANLVQRLAEHQRGQTASTRNRGPWLLVYEERFETLAEARGRERQLKSWKSHRSIRELLKSQQLGARPGPPGRSSVRSRPGPPKTLAKLLFTSFRASLATDSMPPVFCRRVCNAGNGHRKRVIRARTVSRYRCVLRRVRRRLAQNGSQTPITVPACPG